MNVMFRTAPSSGAAWFVVNTHSNREDLAGRNLANQGYEVYAPVLQKQIRHARRVRQVLRPLFPGYLFVRSGPCEMRWRPVLSTLGVRSVVRNGDETSQHKAEQSNAWRTSAPSAFQEREISRWKRARRALWPAVGTNSARSCIIH
jgi:transcription antitermination factor NusG